MHCSSHAGARRMAVTGYDVIVHHADGLCERVDDDGSAEIETARFKFLRKTLAHFGLGRDLFQ